MCIIIEKSFIERLKSSLFLISSDKRMLNYYLQIWGLHGWELIIIAAIIILLFGAKKIPELARSLGRAKAEFKRGQEEVEERVDLDKEKLEKLAKELGINTEGKSPEDLRKEIQKALGK